MINRRENWIAALPADLRARLEACAVERAYDPGETVVRAGAPAAGVHQVMEGYIKVTGLTADGREGLIVVYGPGNCWGESPLIAERPHHHTTTAMTPARVRLIPRADFLRVFHADGAVSVALCRKFSKAMSRLIRHGEAQAADRLSRRVAACFYAFARDLPAEGARCLIDVPLTQSDLASFLGVTRQSVQPEIAALRAAGVLEKRGAAWAVLDVARLRRRAVEVT